MHQSYVYIMTNDTNGTLYIGVTSDLKKRVWKHKNKTSKGFTNKYSLNKLVYYEIFDDIYLAINREKLLKTWHRNWKKDLIEKSNPEWKDLYSEIIK